MKLHLRDPASAITHGIGLLLTLCGAAPLLIKAVSLGTAFAAAMLVFILTMALMYAASSLYHSVTLSDKAIQWFRRVDHSAIFVFIAGSYTPVCLLILEPRYGLPLLAALWAVTAAGILTKFLWITCPKWFSSVIYIAMGWFCVFCIKPLLHALTLPALLWLLAGGIFYTVGGVIYTLRLPLFNARHKNFGTHEIFHVFVMLGTLCHYLFMYWYVL